ncbi:hypothetical protein DFA_09526 [Cavenderia fasciculata]|uniref:SET domain-containing protein n=1 Tax=Cavenderia fasciculata TaxID=261658 RepID=F4Q7V7_CACFS|nr:uncharacterized protein DFA_09526 [Cavenderia fasciculata]EGG15857.1 hypothetical protein DFA_09526 [Cavenderia fasciculata]|eukprot:XP_004352182.1 hypothetical protein DFA_09526 [Cavenderia fasciculata]
MSQQQTEKTEEKRHCAYCLKAISGDEVKKCAGCMRRAYCGRDCQVGDWGNKGQSHKTWCKDKLCEEDIDWEVRETQGKGLGVFAKRMLPKHTKIMVDRGYRTIKETPLDFINSLMPHGGTLQAKWDLNSFFTPEGGDNLGIRLARVNHDCRNNATNKYVTELNSFVLIAIKDIAAGEEITIQYYFYNDFSTIKQVRDIRESIIKPKWDVVCDSTCVCKDAAVVDRIEKAHQLDASIPTMSLRTEADVRKALQAVDNLIAMGEDLSSGIMALSRTYYDGFQLSITNQKTFPLHTKYIEKYLEAVEIVDSKHSNTYAEALRYKTFPESHRNHFSK